MVSGSYALAFSFLPRALRAIVCCSRRFARVFPRKCGTDAAASGEEISPVSSPTAERARAFVLIAALLAVFLGALDALIIGAAMPTIVADLGGLDLYSWVFSAYMLARAVSLPLFGKLADPTAPRGCSSSPWASSSSDPYSPAW